MTTNHKIWIFLAVLVVATFSITLGTRPSNSQQGGQNENAKKEWSIEKYPIADYDATEPSVEPQRTDRRAKGDRYDKKAFVIPNPNPEFIMSTIYDAEPESSPLPYAQSDVVVVGSVLASSASMSNNKAAVYSEYKVQIQNVIKQGTKTLREGEIISIDRAGGRVRYPNGQLILYLNAGQDLPEANGQYVFFLGTDESKSPNYRIITAYQIKDDIITALDFSSKAREFNGRTKNDFIRLISKSK